MLGVGFQTITYKFFRSLISSLQTLKISNYLTFKLSNYLTFQTHQNIILRCLTNNQITTGAPTKAVIAFIGKV